ncbi:Amino acid transporter [Candidatus Filomicrobium marinum]|uniref:Amino acid transporter n=1 Tax=Candidatus Filomicrobium marinum TaxID=1608628 RepID=A0A0D6JJD6_9HYPH|nr:APC family permease [Candidatus Filomicrobium marinum]CFX30606.1 Amino acid transporter [Candidatus Filomicrobium marinum]CPR22073.1 Amino acid transporter [Candidatus Filomicrobium marinum]
MTDLGKPADHSAEAAGPTLKRVMGPWLLLLFIIGDILGTGIYALTGQIAEHVGGVVWLPFLVAFAVALLTAFSYLELVTKYPRAAGAALYAHRAFGIHFVTFIVAFAVTCSGITSASTASRAFAANLSNAFGLGLDQGAGITLVGLAFMLAIALINFRGVGESLKVNVALTVIELTGLLIIITIGLWAIGAGQGDVSRAMEFKTSEDGSFIWPVIAATTLAFFAMVGFEDSVNMAEETKDPSHIFPRILLMGLLLTAIIYVLVSISAITLVPPEQLSQGETPLLQVVQAGAPSFPIEIFGLITMFAVANTALINMMMASRLIYGMSREHVLPPVLGKVHAERRTPYVAIAFTTLLAFALITFVGEIPALGGTTALLLLCVFTVVNVAVLILRKENVDHRHFRAPTIVPILGMLSCGFLIGPWTGRNPDQYLIAAVLIGIGIALWFVTVWINRTIGLQPEILEPDDIAELGPRN